MVVHAYKAANEEELTLLRGERVYIHSKSEEVTGDVGWWLGSIDQRSGVFPVNYVLEGELLEADIAVAPAPPLSPRTSHHAPLLAPVAPPTSTGTATSAQTSLSSSPTESTLKEVPFTELTIVRTIGRGGFGQVFFARLRGADVAVKQIDTSMMSDKEIKKRSQELRCVPCVSVTLLLSSYRAEGELLATCAHRNIARLLGACTLGPFCLIMEFARGVYMRQPTALHDYVQAGRCRRPCGRRR